MLRKAQSYPDRRLARFDHIIVHVTATKPDMDWGAAEVDALHKGLGWRGCGYHAVIRRNGDWEDHDGGFPARPIGVAGAHVGDCGRGWNGRSLGISMAGGIDDNGRADFNMTAVQMETLRKGIETILSLHPKPDTVRILGHRDLIAETGAPPKACPCFDVIPWWLSLAEDLDEEEDAGRAPTPMNQGEVWVVQSGDTLAKISRNTGVSLSTIMRLNPEIVDADLIQPGQKIKLL